MTCQGLCRVSPATPSPDPRMLNVSDIDHSPKMSGPRKNRRYCTRCRASFRFRDESCMPARCPCCQGNLRQHARQRNRTYMVRKVARI